MTSSQLATTLHQLDRAPYPRYKSLKGRYDFPDFTLSIDHVQGDPFAAPSRLSVSVPHQSAGLPPSLFSSSSRRTGTEVALNLAFAHACEKTKARLGSGKSGLLAIDTPGQQLIPRTALEITPTHIIARFVAGLPAAGRRIMGHAAAELLTELIPQVVQQSLIHANLPAERLQQYADTAEDADHLRAALDAQQLVAFVADGAILPRASGIDDRPLENATPFRSPASLSLTIDLPHAGSVSGMGIPAGVTLIVGGGYHGKSTLLRALELGIYNHRPGDGRERVVSRADAVKVRAEDGRAVTGVDLSPFISNLPGGQSTTRFTTPNASGSTSQAANILEAIESGSRLLLLDEDISATNFLIRDERMQKLIAPEKEPITPFVRRVREMYDTHGISTILVLGGSGDYFGPADRVIALDHFLPHDLTNAAKALAAPEPPPLDSGHWTLDGQSRIPHKNSLDPTKPSRGPRPPRRNIRAHDTRALTFGSDEVDLSLVPQLLDASQLRTIGHALAYATESHLIDGHHSIPQIARTLTDLLQQNGLTHFGGHDLAAIRPHDLCATLNRLRSLQL